MEKRFRVAVLFVMLGLLASLVLAACGDNTATTAPAATTAAAATTAVGTTAAGTTAAGTTKAAGTTAAGTTAAGTTAAGTTAGTTAAGTTAAGTTAAGTVATSGGYLDTIKQRGKLIIGVKFDVPTFGLKNPTTNQVDGFDADIGRELAKVLLGDASKVEFVEALSANRIPFLQEDKVDLVISTMTINEDRKKQIDFSDPYYIAGQSILVKKGSTIKSVADLSGKNVCSAQGSTSEQNIRAKAPQAKLTLFGGYSECYTALENGQVDAVSTDDIILFGLKLRAPDKYELVGGQFTNEPYGIGMKKGRPELVSFVNGTLTAMKNDGRWKTLYDKNIKPASGVSAEPPK
jgi:aspartate/glutamate/glutamine transport system substrate-binding protein